MLLWETYGFSPKIYEVFPKDACQGTYLFLSVNLSKVFIAVLLSVIPSQLGFSDFFSFWFRKLIWNSPCSFIMRNYRPSLCFIKIDEQMMKKFMLNVSFFLIGFFLLKGIFLSFSQRQLKLLNVNPFSLQLWPLWV